jgi:hypothetical protein
MVLSGLMTVIDPSSQGNPDWFIRENNNQFRKKPCSGKWTHYPVAHSKPDARPTPLEEQPVLTSGGYAPEYCVISDQDERGYLQATQESKEVTMRKIARCDGHVESVD